MRKISVIVPNYNHAKYLKQRLDSVLNQTYKDFELLVLDDNSADNSRKIVDDYAKRFPEIIRYYNEINSGSASKQWDYGVSKSHGEYIWIAESDDFAEPEFLEKTSSILSGNDNVGLVYCNSRIIDDLKKTEYFTSGWKKNLRKNKWAIDYFNNGKREISECLYRQNTINNVSGVLFRKSKYIEAGLADHSIRYCGDWYLYIRILLISDIAYISLPLNALRLHPGSTFHENFKNSTYLLEVLRIYLFTSSKIDLTPKMKIIMLRNLLGIMRRIFTQGRFPEFNKVFKILADHKRSRQNLISEIMKK
jgi:glycosyltransferase involved in cell wall biosynthesis